jgi:hypothetical protein
LGDVVVALVILQSTDAVIQSPQSLNPQTITQSSNHQITKSSGLPCA